MSTETLIVQILTMTDRNKLVKIANCSDSTAANLAEMRLNDLSEFDI